MAVVTDMEDAGLDGDISLVRGTTSDGKSGLGAETYRPSDDELNRLDPKKSSHSLLVKPLANIYEKPMLSILQNIHFESMYLNCWLMTTLSVEAK